MRSNVAPSLVCVFYPPGWVVKASCACSLICEGIVVMGGNRHCRHVDRGWKERLKVTSLYAKESCSLIKLIRNLLWLCTMEAVMVLECARVCSGCLWWALLLLGGVFIYTSIKNPIPANNGLRHLSLLLKSHEMENINFDWNIFILKKSFSVWLSFLFTFWGSGGFWRCHAGCCFSFLSPQMLFLVEQT